MPPGGHLSLKNLKKVGETIEDLVVSSNKRKTDVSMPALVPHECHEAGEEFEDLVVNSNRQIVLYLKRGS